MPSEQYPSSSKLSRQLSTERMAASTKRLLSIESFNRDSAAVSMLSVQTAFQFSLPFSHQFIFRVRMSKSSAQSGEGHRMSRRSGVKTLRSTSCITARLLLRSRTLTVHLHDFRAFGVADLAIGPRILAARITASRPSGRVFQVLPPICRSPIPTDGCGRGTSPSTSSRSGRPGGR